MAFLFIFGVIILLLIFTVFIAFIYGSYNIYFDDMPKVPGPANSNPFFGHTSKIISCKPRLIGILDEWIKEFGPIFKFKVQFGQSRLIIADPEFLKHVLVTNCTNYKKPHLSGIKKEVISVGRSGLVFSNGDVHKKHRRLIQPIFKISSVRAFVPTMVKKATELVEFWEKEILDESSVGQKGTEINIKEDIARMTLEIIGKIGFGHDFNEIKQETRLGNICRALIESNDTNGFIKVLPFSEYYPIPQNLQFWKNLFEFHTAIDGMIQDKITKMIKGEYSHDPFDILDLMLRSKDAETGETLDPVELREEIMTFLFAGHETTSLGLSWTLLELAKHPDVQAKCRQEAMELMKRVELSELTWEKLENMKYIEATIKEALRLHSPVPISPRLSIRDDVIGGYKIPAGTTVFCYAYSLHRNTEVWQDADKFMPERFMEQDGSSSYTYLPFVAGPRMCIGNKFAMVEMIMALTMFLSKFEFLPHPTIKYESVLQLTLAPDPHLKLMVRKLK